MKKIKAKTWIEVCCKGENTLPNDTRTIKVRASPKHYYEQDGTKYIKDVSKAEHLAIRIVKVKGEPDKVYRLYPLDAKVE